MIGTNHMRQVRSRLLATAFVSMFAASCAAPDAQPAIEEVIAANAGEPQWGIALGEATTDQHGFDIALDPTTDTVVATIGYFVAIDVPNPELMTKGTFLSLGSRDVLVVKYSATGNQPLWAVPVQSEAEMVRAVVEIDFQGNVIVAGGHNGTLQIPGLDPHTTLGSYDAYITKMDPSGKPLWVRAFGNNTENFITDIATDGDGNIIVVGMARGPAFDFGMGIAPAEASTDDIFVAKFDSAGTALWAHRVGRAGSGEWWDPAVTLAVSRVDGSIIVAGTHADTLVFPSLQFPVLGVNDGFIVKLDAQGNGIWQQTFGTKDRRQRINHIVYAPNGEVFLTGAYSGSVTLGKDSHDGYLDSYDLLVAKLDAQGNYVWSRGYGHDGNQLGNHISLDSRGNVLVIGTFDGVIDLFGSEAIINSNVDGTDDVFAAKFNPSGKPLWGRAYGDREGQNAGGAVQWKTSDGQDRAIIVGMVGGLIDLSPKGTELKSAGLQDGYLMSIAH